MVETTLQAGAQYVQDQWTVGTAINIGHVHLGRERTPLFASAIRDRQLELIQLHTEFGGRERELEKLELSLKQTQRPYHFVWGPSGFGKTALLANWVARLHKQGISVCFHFINRLDGMAGEEVVLRNLCEQLVDFFGLNGELPASVDKLRAAYLQLLQHATPDGRSLIIVIDGLDEAKDWTPGSTFFPTRLPDDTHVFFSARAEDDKSYKGWLSQLSIVNEQVDAIRLDRLGMADIRQLLHDSEGNAAASAEDQSFVEAISTVSDGDPFFLHHLVKDIQRGDITRENVWEQPKGLQGYLERWKTDLFDDVDIVREEAYALLMVLIAALGRLKPREFMDISPTLRKGMLLQRELSGKLRRYLVGNRETGYALCHPRFRTFLCDDPFIEAELDDCRRALLDYCKRWREHKSDYALNHLATHLAEAGETTELNLLIDTTWKQARYEQSGSHRLFAKDLEISIDAALKETPPRAAMLIPACLAYTTLMSLAGKLPPGLLGVMARLGRLQSAHDHAALIPNPDTRAKAYLAIGRALEKTGESNKVKEYLVLSLVAAEQIVDPEACAEILTQLTEAFHRIDDATGLAEALKVMERVGRELTKDSLLVGITSSFRRVGAPGKATEFARRARTAYESAGWTLFPDPKPALSALVTAGLLDEAEEFLEGNGRLTGVEDALRKLHEAKRESLDGLDTVELANQVGAVLGISGGLDFSGFSGDSEKAHKSEMLCQRAGIALQAGDRENARILALKAFEWARAEQASYGTFGIGSSLSHLCNVTATLAKVGDRQAAAEAAFVALGHYEANRWLSVHELIRIPLVFAQVGENRTAHDLMLKITRATAGDATAAGALVLLAIELIDMNMTSTAGDLVDELITTIETLGPEPRKVMALAGLALGTARNGSADEAVEIADSVLPRLDQLDACEEKMRALGRLALVRAIAEPFSGLEAECARANLESRQDSYKLVACTTLAQAFVECEQSDKAQSLVNDAVETARQSKTRDADWGRQLVDCARTMHLLGNDTWAVEQLQKLLPLTRGNGSIAAQAHLLGNIAVALMDSGEVGQAGDLAQETLERAVSYNTNFMIRHLPEVTDALIAVGEASRASTLVQAALDALGTMEPDWQFAKAMPSVAEAVSRIGDGSVLASFESLSKKDLRPADRIAFLGSLSKAQMACGPKDRAQTSATRALNMVLENSSFKIDVLVQVTEALAQTGDGSALMRLSDWALEGSAPGVSAGALLAIIPSLATVGDKATLERVTRASSELRSYDRARVLGAAVLAWLSLKDRSEAERVAAKAHEAFDEVRDGAVTPQMIEYLVPALRALRDRDGLVRVLKMPRSKAPYRREYVPTLRALLPALAEAGVDDVDPMYINALRGEEPALGEAQSGIAAVQAQRGEFEKARQTAASIAPPGCRAAALVSIGRAIAAGPARGDATVTLLEALSTATGTQSNISLVCDVTRATVEIGDDKALSRLVLQELERISQVSFIGIDSQLYLKAVRTLAGANNKDRIARAGTIAMATTHPVARAEALAALHLALMENDHSSEIHELEIKVRTAIDALEDSSAKAIPLCYLAKSFTLAGRQVEASHMICQACDAGRFLERGMFLRVLDLVFEVLSEEVGRNPIELYQAIDRADLLWEAPAGQAGK